MSSLSRRQRELLNVLNDYTTPQSAATLARTMRYKHGLKSPSLTYDLLGALKRKGLAELRSCGWSPTHTGRIAEALDG